MRVCWRKFLIFFVFKTGLCISLSRGNGVGKLTNEKFSKGFLFKGRPTTYKRKTD